ncbi:hypothetical protein SAMN04488074_11783 [Lentzea albidocapillata subsp. violacea]|uniref:Uncharacterized protein n=1 Tax=Lentzea albidocapillata subsp. violacea TaxID=128104 RepID=A0A1G9QY73_9PSEU|nr:hypothetical protein [Lentzea albidocapillata]SDM15195.1 hypothetical protein SAMN04488074_11783 [Lentzea albidocapillata subsp. violacea]
MRTGTVWLASGQTGEVTLVNGAAAETVARVPVATPARTWSTSTVEWRLRTAWRRWSDPR